MEQLYLNDVLVDIKPNTIRQTKQVNTVADMGSRQANFTNQFILPFTEKNLTTLEGLGVIGSRSRKPYQKMKADLKIGGINLITNGYAWIKQNTTNEYSAVIYDGTMTLKEFIGEGDINDLDFSYLTSGNIEVTNNASNTSKFCYPFGDLYNRITHNTTAPNFVMDYLGYAVQVSNPVQPALYIKGIFEQIFTEANLTISGDFLNSDSFTKEVINLNKSFPYSGATNEIGGYIHEQSKWDFIKDVVNRYGLLLEINGSAVHFTQMESILSGNEGFEDWSDKFQSLISVKYEAKNIGKENTIEVENEAMLFTREEVTDNDNIIQQSDVIEDYQDDFPFNEPTLIENDFLPKTKEIFKWNFVKPAYKTKINASASASIGLGYLAFIPYFEAVSEATELLLNSVSSLSVERRLFKVYNSPASVGYLLGSNNTVTTNFFYDESETDPKWYLDNYYTSYFKMMEDFKLNECLMNLSLLDVHHIDFKMLKYIKQLGGYFYLNKVKDWQRDKLTKVELVKVYPQIPQITTPQINNQGLGSGLEMTIG